MNHQLDIFDNGSASQVGERQTDLEDLIAEVNETLMKVKPMQSYEIVIDGESGTFQDNIDAANKNELYKVLKEKYPEDIGADAAGYDQDGEEFAIKW